MFCSTHSNALVQADAACTTSEKTESSPEKNPPPEPDVPPQQPGKSEAGLAARAALLRARRAFRLPFGAGLILLGLGFAGYFIADFGADTFAWLAGVCAWLILFTLVRSWMFSSALSETQYYSLPGSKVEGQHGCIHCGHPEIFAHDQYASTRTHHDCARCKNNLFVS